MVIILNNHIAIVNTTKNSEDGKIQEIAGHIHVQKQV